MNTHAIAEQLRIANLIALAQITHNHPPNQIAQDARAALTTYHEHSHGGWHELHPDISSALGITPPAPLTVDLRPPKPPTPNRDTPDPHGPHYTPAPPMTT